jgi:hypothetical protein
MAISAGTPRLAPLELQVIVSPAVDIAIGGTFSPTTATIITGRRKAHGMTIDDADAQHHLLAATRAGSGAPA